MNELQDWISIEEAAARTPYSKRHLRLLAQQGKIKSIKVGKRTWIIYWPSLQEYAPGAQGWPAGKSRKG